MLYILKTDIKIAILTGYILLVLSDPMVSAENHDAEKAKKLSLQNDIAKQTELIKSFSSREIEIIEELNKIDFTLNQARRKTLSISKEITSLKNKIAKLSRKKNQLSNSIILNREYTTTRLNALYKMSKTGTMEAAGQPDSLFDFFLRQNAMERIIAYDFNLLKKQNQSLEHFYTVEQKIKRDMHVKINLEVQLNNQIKLEREKLLKKQGLLKQIRKKKQLSLAAVESFKLAELKLDQHIADMEKNSNQSALNVLSFEDYKGKLLLPVNGSIITKYGHSRKGKYNSFTFQKGIDIKVERGEPVKSIFKGEVLFASWLKSYGNLIIIDHGDNFYTLYAHVEDLFKQKGDSVETGEVIATAGDTGSIKGVCLHFEVRHHGVPVNPMKWFKKGV